MITLPKIEDIQVNDKKVIVRADLDIDVVEEGKEQRDNIYRLEALLPTLKYLFEKNCDIYLIGHRGRPEGGVDESLSLKPVSNLLEGLLKTKWGENEVGSLKMHVLENLRFDLGETANDQHYAQHLAEKGEVYINESFATSHQEHASIVSLPRLLPHAAGFRFVQEVETLSKLRDNPQRPFVVVMGGVKQDKTDYLMDLASFADKILVASRLPDFVSENSEMRVDVRFEFAKLLPDKEDITIRSIENFEKEILDAKTVFVAGPVGKYEEEGHMMGTKRVFEAVVKSSAFKIAGGGDTVSAIQKLGIQDKFNWISVGGGASLEFLAKGTLPGIQALIE